MYVDKPFLEEVAVIIQRVIKEGKQPTVVLPGLRAGIYLKQHLYQLNPAAQWLPEICTIEQLVGHISGLEISEPLKVWNMFYDMLCQDPTFEESFDDVMKWCPVLITEYNDIDMYMADTVALFSYLDEAKKIELWNLGRSAPTPAQEKYLAFWKNMGTRYQLFKAYQKKMGCGYRGHVYRMAAEHIASYQTNPQAHYLFAGFNALSKSEQEIIGYFLENKTGTIIWDCDRYYYEDEKQEAGRFIRLYHQQWMKTGQSILLEQENLVTGAIEILTAGCPGTISQSAYAGALAGEWHSEGISDIGIIPANEETLETQLSYLPETASALNISIGLPVQGMAVPQMIKQVLELIQNYRKDGFYFIQLIELIDNPVIKSILDISGHNNAYGRLRTGIAESGISRWNSRKLDTYISQAGLTEGRPIVQLMAAFEEDEASYCLHLKKFIVEMRSIAESRKPVNTLFTYLLGEALHIFENIRQHTQNRYLLPETYTQLLIQEFNRLHIPFRGNPLGGIQLTGILETRCLDFSHVIITGLNEGTLPSSSVKSISLIPQDIRMVFGLPTTRDSDALYAYYFYRLIQRTKKAALIYLTQTDELGSGEKSRFILQLAHELVKKNPKASYKETIVYQPFGSGPEAMPIQIKSTSDIRKIIQERFGEKGFSQSALATLKNCSLRFYYTYIANIQESVNPEEDAQANEFGSFVHKILEEVFNKIIHSPEIKTPEVQLAYADEIAASCFNEVMPGKTFDSGVNYLQFHMAKILCKKVIRLYFSETTGKSATRVQATEKKFTRKISGKRGEYLLYGIADRFDETATGFRIVDYKTGKTEPGELKCEGVEELFDSPAKDKAFQLMFYTLISGMTGAKGQAALLSLKKLSQKYLYLSSEMSQADVIQIFESRISALLDELFSEHFEFVQTRNEENCQYCSYAQICMR